MAEPSAKLTIRLNPADNVVVARTDLLANTAIAGENVTTRAHVPSGHKVATQPIAKGEPVKRYNQIIGFATADIAPGDHVHTHNIAMGDFARDYAFTQNKVPTQYANDAAMFQGIVRKDGRVATRNYIGILTSVNCSATVANYIAEAFKANPFTGHNPLADYPNVDGVVALTHKTGCGMNDGDALELLRRTMGGYARHPNFSAVFIVGLGCEVNQIGGLMKAGGFAESERFHTFTIQDTGGTTRSVQKGVAQIRELLPEVNKVKREPVPASHITIGLQCGGSDGYSGISANPALGAASDLLVKHGGTVILSETPETYGAEHLLTRRAVSQEVGEKLVALMKWWEEYTARNKGEMNQNPSPGNKAGGITTILEKSLGAAAKAGTTNLVDVYQYAEEVKAKGFVFMDTPGYDPVSATGQVAGGANMICFTTGRGSVYGCKPAPSIKLATNSNLYKRMTDDMDINCGTIVDGTETVQECGARIFDLILRVASGERTKSEQLGFGADEFAPWQLGAVM
jgi:altronate hydrolase